MRIVMEPVSLYSEGANLRADGGAPAERLGRGSDARRGLRQNQKPVRRRALPPTPELLVKMSSSHRRGGDRLGEGGGANSRGERSGAQPKAFEMAKSRARTAERGVYSCMKKERGRGEVGGIRGLDGRPREEDHAAKKVIVF